MEYLASKSLGDEADNDNDVVTNNRSKKVTNPSRKDRDQQREALAYAFQKV
jgi:hypothetical protein